MTSLIDIDKIAYEINRLNIKNIPLADDFCMNSTNKKTHQIVINDINLKVESMGLKLKPFRYDWFSLSGGKPTVINFKIEDKLVSSIP